MSPLLPRRRKTPQRIRHRIEARVLLPKRAERGPRCGFVTPHRGAQRTIPGGARRPDLR